MQAVQIRLNWRRGGENVSFPISKSITDRYKINGLLIPQPDEDMQCSFETTYSEGSNRTQKGVALITPLFTVIQYSYKATNVPVDEKSTNLVNAIIKGKPFILYHWLAHKNEWRSEKFYVGKMHYNIRHVGEYYSEISFNMQGVNPLD